MGVLDPERVDTGIVQFVQRAERNARFFEKFSSRGGTKGEGTNIPYIQRVKIIVYVFSTAKCGSLVTVTI